MVVPYHIGPGKHLLGAQGFFQGGGFIRKYYGFARRCEIGFLGTQCCRRVDFGGMGQTFHMCPNLMPGYIFLLEFVIF